MIEEIVKAAEQLVEAIKFDDSGVNGKGGNGGLISQVTIRKSDDLRVLLLRYRLLQIGTHP
jgi:hypothetical protein